MELFLAFEQETPDVFEKEHYDGFSHGVLSDALILFMSTTSYHSNATFRNKEGVVEALNELLDHAIIIQPTLNSYPRVRLEKTRIKEIHVYPTDVHVIFEHTPKTISRYGTNPIPDDDLSTFFYKEKK